MLVLSAGLTDNGTGSDKATGMSELTCPGCGKQLDPQHHGELVCDGQVWCDACRLYDRRLLLPRPFADIVAWGQRLCAAFGLDPVEFQEAEPFPEDPNPYPHALKLLMAEAHHRDRIIVFFPPGLRLATLCHELAHLATGQDHTAGWARMFAEMTAWVKERLPEDTISRGIKVNLLGNQD